MRKSIVLAAALACGALGCSFNASAVPIKVGLTGAAGLHDWTSPGIGDPSYVNLSAWQFENGQWTSAFMVLNSDQTGLGVCAQQPIDGNTACPTSGDSNEIDSNPWQVIDLSITGDPNWKSASVTLFSVDPGFTGSLFGATCSPDTANCSPITPAFQACAADYPNETTIGCTFSFSPAAVSGYTDLWIMASGTNPKGTDRGNVLLSVDFVMNTVPEPASWGVFGLGLLLVGAFAGLRRRRRLH